MRFSVTYVVFISMAILSSCSGKRISEETIASSPKPPSYLILKKNNFEGPIKEHHIELEPVKSAEDISPTKYLAEKPEIRNFREYEHSALPPVELFRGKDIGIDSLKGHSNEMEKMEIPSILVKEIQPVKALEPHYKDFSKGNIQYLDVEEGLPSSYVWKTFMDTRSNLWIGTEGAGVIKYNGEYFTSYDNRSGLSNNSVREILQAHDGEMWFGTHGGGLVRFDGVHFYHYTTEHGLLSNYIWSLAEDSRGVLWIGTENGLNKLEGGQIHQFELNGYDRDFNIRNLFFDSEGSLWIGTNSDGFFRKTGMDFIHYSLLKEDISYTTYDIFEDSQKNIWVGTERHGAIKISDSSYFSFTTSQGLHSNHIRDIEEDRQGNIWMATFGAGVIKFDGKAFINFSEDQGLSSDYSRHLLEDSNENIWVGTDGGGLSKISPNAIANYSKNDGLVSDYCRGISQDSIGNLWIANYGGLNYLNEGKVHIYTKKQGLLTEDLISTYIDEKGTIWIGTFNNGLICFDGKYFSHYDKDDGLSGKSIRYITKDSNGRIWFASDDNGVTMFDHGLFYHITTENGLPGSVVWKVYEDKDQTIWMATDEGLVSFKNNTLKIFDADNGLPSNLIRSIYQDVSGLIWVGTYDNGIFILNDGGFYHLNDENGLPNNMISDIIGDNQNYVWVANEKGINALKLIEEGDDSASFDFKWFQKEDGLRSLDFYFNSGFKDSKGNLWLGGGKSLVNIEPQKIMNTANDLIPQLESVYLMGEFVDFRSQIDERSSQNSKKELMQYVEYGEIEPYLNYPDRLNLSHQINTISFQFYVKGWYSGKQAIYQYYLEGFDEEWGQPTIENSVSYNLTAGNYRLFVRSKDPNGTFGEPFIYEFTINPPIWLTWWMILIYLFLTGSIILLIINLRLKKIQKDKKRLEEIVNQRTIELSDRNMDLEILNREKDEMMNIVAHDLRSPFHKINGFIQLTEMDGELNENQQEYMVFAKEVVNESVEMIQNLLDAYTTKHKSHKLIEIDLKVFIREWIKGFEQQIHKKSQHLHFSMDPKVSTIFSDISSLKRILDNIMSNAIKYSKKDKNIFVLVESEDGCINFSIKDEGPGFSEEDLSKLFKKFEKLSAKPTDGENSTGLGLSIVKSLVNNLGGEINVNTRLGYGTEFVVRLPKNSPN